MRHIRRLPVACLFAMLSAAAAAQDNHASVDRRGAVVMGFDQTATAHHFLLYPDGGAIDVAVKDPSDIGNREAIRSHLPHIARMFADGEFDAPMLVHDTRDVPGVSVMAARKATIRYDYVETPAGGRVDVVTTDPESLAAIHAFLRFQISDHHTGDPAVVQQKR